MEACAPRSFGVGYPATTIIFLRGFAGARGSTACLGRVCTPWDRAKSIFAASQQTSHPPRSGYLPPDIVTFPLQPPFRPFRPGQGLVPFPSRPVQFLGLPGPEGSLPFGVICVDAAPAHGPEIALRTVQINWSIRATGKGTGKSAKDS
jgi:hypothetical protein